MFVQKDLIRDFIFPIAIATKHEDGYNFERFLGTGFLIGNRGYALTASHVVYKSESLVGMFIGEDRGWYAFEIEVCEHHPTQDVALIKFINGKWSSIFEFSSEHVHAGLEYSLSGYPTDALHEDLNNGDISGRIKPRPDMIYSKGHIRRRISWNLNIPGVKGDAFIELSAVAGSGCSGSPVFKIIPNKQYEVLGIYTGERLNDRATSVSYAVRNDAFVSWIPAILNKSILEESKKSEEQVSPP